MNVTELRQRMERLERAGGGECRVEVAPTPPPKEAVLGINFDTYDYEVTGVEIYPWQRGASVTLQFSERP